MPFMGKTSDGYSELSTIVNSSGTEIDYVLSKTDDGYKRTFTKQRELTGEVPLSFKGITPAPDLTNYRIYGQTSRNLFDENTVTKNKNIYNGSINNSSASNLSDYIPIKNNSAYILSWDADTLSSTDSRQIAIFNSQKEYLGYIFISVYENYTIQLQALIELNITNAAYIRITVDKQMTNIMLNSGSTPLPYEPYGESVGDRTGNLAPTISTENGWVMGYISGGTYTPNHNNGEMLSPFMSIADVEEFVISAKTISSTPSMSVYFYENDTYIQGYGRTANDYTGSVFSDIPNTATHVRFAIRSGVGKNGTIQDVIESGFWVMLNSGSEPLPYEPYGYRVPVTVEGKNICNNSWEQKIIDANTGNTSPTPNAVCCDFIPVKPNVTYSCSRTIRNNYNNLRCYGANKNYLGTGADLANKSNPLGQWESFGTFMITDARVSYIRFNDLSNSLDTKYMLVEGTYTAETMPSYEPYQPPVTTPIYLPEQIKMVGDEAEYVDYQEQKLHRVRKNLLQNTGTSQTINGVTFTVNSDGSVTCNGTASANTFFPIGGVPINKLIVLTGCPKNGGYNNYLLRAHVHSSIVTYEDIGNGARFNTAAPAYCEIRIASGYTCNNLTFYPMIRKADIEDDTYEPYIENTDLDVTLPALPTLAGTNTMSVGTEVQPSRVYLKGAIKALPSGGDT